MWEASQFLSKLTINLTLSFLLPVFHPLFSDFSLTWDTISLSISQHTFSDLICLRSGIQPCFSATMNAGHRQTTVRPRWRFPRSVWRGERWMLIDSVSGLLPAWRSIAFCSGPVSNFRPKPGIYPPGDGRYLSRHKAPTCLYSAPVVFLANYPAQTGFVLISMGEKGRLQDWRGAGPNNQVKYYFASWLRI